MSSRSPLGLFIVGGLVVVMVTATGCRRRSLPRARLLPGGLSGQPSQAAQPPQTPPPPIEQPPEPPAVDPPTTVILYQPELLYTGEEPRLQGTGFFARAPNDRFVAVTSAHFFELDGPNLEKVRWRDVRDGHVVATMTRCRGGPGRALEGNPPDASRDFMLFPVKLRVPMECVLEFDDRDYPRVNERVWLPDKSEYEANGYRLVDGTVRKSGANAVFVELDFPIELQSQSGSPIISQKTGKVVGILSGGVQHDGKSIIILTSAGGIRKAIETTGSSLTLKSVIGKAKKK